MSWSERLNVIAAMGIGAACAFWFSYFVWGTEEADGAAQIMSVVWVSVIFLKLWIEKRAKNA